MEKQHNKYFPCYIFSLMWFSSVKQDSQSDVISPSTNHQARSLQSILITCYPEGIRETASYLHCTSSSLSLARWRAETGRNLHAKMTPQHLAHTKPAGNTPTWATRTPRTDRTAKLAKLGKGSSPTTVPWASAIQPSHTFPNLRAAY